MAAASANRADSWQPGEVKAHKVDGGSTIYKNTLVCHNSLGFLAPGADTASFNFAGVAYEKCDNAAGSDGDKKCKVYKMGEFEFAYNGGDATQAVVGKEVYIVDDQTVDDDALATTNDIKCGVITEFVSAAKVRVRINTAVR